MFGKKQKRIEELERKIDGYVVRVRRYREVIDQQEEKIQSLIKELEEKEETRTLEEIRIDKGMTKQQVANKLGTNSSYYLAQVEKGLKNPTLDYIQKLAYVYEMTPAQIVESLTIDGWRVSDGIRK